MIVSTVNVTTGWDSSVGEELFDNEDHWNDVVLTYETLKRNRFKDEDIYVFYAYGDEEDYLPLLDSSNLVVDPLEASREEIKNFFQCLAPGETCVWPLDSSIPGFSTAQPTPLTAGDFLFVVWIGHGENTWVDVTSGTVNEACPSCPDCLNSTDCQMHVFVNNVNTTICDCELAAWLDKIPVKRRALLFNTCQAGGMIDTLEGPGSVVMTSCRSDQPENSIFGFSLLGTDMLEHRVWLYSINEALWHLVGLSSSVPADLDTNNLVSLCEAYESTLNAEHLNSDPAVGPIPDDSQEIVSCDVLKVADVAPSDDRNIAPCVHLRLDEPAADVSVFSKDSIHDWSNEPSAGRWWDGPDLWVRNTCSCFDDSHEEPMYGQTNYLCSRVHNLGCEELGGVAVKFLWIESSGWPGGPGWHEIGTTTINIPFGKSATTPPVPWPDVEFPGSYCLRSVADAAGDLGPHPLTLPYKHNNLTQINVSVLAAAAAVSSTWPFFIENAGEPGLNNVDLQFDLTGLPSGSEVRLEIPGEIAPPESVGVSLDHFGGWTILDMSEAAGVVEIDQLRIDPGERRRALMRLRLPVDVKVPVAEIRMTESVGGVEVGGIVFQARLASREEVLCRSLRTLVTSLRELAMWIGDDAAVSVLAAIEPAEYPCDLSVSIDLYNVVQDVFRDNMQRHLETVVGDSPLFGQRLRSAANAFLIPGEDLHVSMFHEARIEHARELALYSWLVVPEPRW